MVGKINYNVINKTVSIETDHEIIYYRYANFGERFVARILDILILLIPNFILPFISSWLYFSLQQCSNKQATIGQSAMGIMLISDNGMKVSFGQTTGRFFANLLNAFFLGLSYFMVLFTDKKQCIHDMISGCLVVKEISRSPKL